MPGASQSSNKGLFPLTVGVDIGTTALKAVAADEDGRVVERLRLPCELVVGPDGQFEHDAAASWWEAPRRAWAQLLASLAPRAVAGVAVSAFMPSVAAVGPEGRPLGPGLLYGDSRGGDGSAQERGADPTASGEMARLARWAASETPEAAGYWPAQAVANAALGGEGVLDLASAFATGGLFGGQGWGPEACAAAGLVPEQLPRVAVFGEAVGKVGLLGDVVAGDGQAPLDGVVLAAGSVDGLCEQIVAGAGEDGDVVVGLGSTLVVWVTVPGWPAEVPGLWRVPHTRAGKAMVGGASNAGGMWVDWVDRLLRPAPGGAEVRPGDVPVWWPWVRGERVPWHDPGLRAGFGGAELSFGPEALRRGAFEATGFVARHILELASASGVRPRRVLVNGGGARNAPWLQALADVLGQPVHPASVPEGAALGAAFLARMALGLETSIDDAARWARRSAPVEPRRDWSAAAEERYQRWLEGLPAQGPAPAPGSTAPSSPAPGPVPPLGSS
jgi:xylulokinase